MKNLSTLQKEASLNIIYRADIHWISYVLPLGFIIFGFVGVIGLILKTFILFSIFFAFLFIKGITHFLQNKNTFIYVHNNHLTFSTGILGKNIIDISLDKTEGIIVFQNVLGRIFNFGTLTVITGEVTHSYKIKDPIGLRNAIMEQTKKIAITG
ncbi:PH domain-containing protein [Chryseobacterium nematophagum]|uniref:PH domain-containing protein n=1 Tax=Chryseobacterium nematophagum TaxID=2305228 RepID=A0A3M7L8V2_9FLAO|nr:PH domain-containing protein [Chryseobacterium nematophagum]RMZ58454.1 PH domain-containing protein [Chryseobacterium nematophagum]